jgi:hypothetical protein
MKCHEFERFSIRFAPFAEGQEESASRFSMGKGANTASV